MSQIPQFLYLILWFAMVVFAISMIAQGWMINNARQGYSKSPKVKHPELNDVKAGDSLLVVKFSDEDIQELQRQALQQKIDELFDKLSSYEDEEDEDDDGDILVRR